MEFGEKQGIRLSTPTIIFSEIANNCRDPRVVRLGGPNAKHTQVASSARTYASQHKHLSMNTVIIYIHTIDSATRSELSAAHACRGCGFTKKKKTSFYRALAPNPAKYASPNRPV